NGAGINNNRVAYQDGWVFPPHPTLYRNGYSVLTQPEGAAVTKYLERVREKELRGRRFAVAADMHGPVPVGAVLLHDQGNTPEKLVGVHDLAERIKQAMDEVFASYFTEHGLAAHQLVAKYAGEARDEAMKIWTQIFGSQDEKAAYLTLQWAEYATIWEHIDYTVSGSFGGWSNSNAGLGAESISFEIDCLSYEPWNPPLMQLFTDNIRAIAETSAVHAALKSKPVDRKNLKATVGYYDSGDRVTDADGNPSAPPKGFPGNPLVPQIKQTPYDVSNTDYFRDLRQIVSSPLVEVNKPHVKDGLLHELDTFVISDTTFGKADVLERYVKEGGNLVLTDGALRLVPELVDIDADFVQKNYSYVGYSDLIREHPMTDGLYDRARQMYDPIGLGYELLMERDQYWPCGNGCEKSPTKNSSPNWTIDRAEWERVGGETVGTADPPESRKGGAEGNETNKTNIGVLKLGKGKIIIFGALLPQPTERFPHWFGLNAYSVSIPGQQLLLKALAGKTN
ncbi:MAG TPA: hypothetical protein VNP73_03205, partial [Actinomycetota bacterium]|nr:hypothetical protein [Actinomycetota bacterium]